MAEYIRRHREEPMRPPRREKTPLLPPPLVLLATVAVVAPCVMAGGDLSLTAPPTSLFAGPVKPATGPTEWTKPLPVTFSLDYTLTTDNVFRGINFSEYRGEGREGLNHQLTVGVEADLGRHGAVGASFWFAWYAFQEQLTPAYDGNIQEIDYKVYYRYECEKLATTLETGWIAYTFPAFGGDGHATYELYVQLGFDDSKLFGTDSPVLNPYVYYGLDYDLANGGSWLEIGVSHDFVLGEISHCKDVPILKDVTITPSVALGVDIHYLDDFDVLGNGGEASSTRLANVLYGLNVSYNLSGALDLPPQIGSLTLSGFLNYSQALRDGLLDDELFGGVNLGWS